MLFKLLDSYIPQPADFLDQHVAVQGGEMLVVPKPAGFSLMVHLLNDTPMLRMVSDTSVVSTNIRPVYFAIQVQCWRLKQFFVGTFILQLTFVESNIFLSAHWNQMWLLCMEKKHETNLLT